MNFIFSLLSAFLLTVVLEFLIYCIFFKKSTAEIFIYCFLINSFTWPIANYAYSVFAGFVLVELAIVLAESFLLKLLFRIKYPRALLLSCIANFITTLISLLFLYL